MVVKTSAETRKTSALTVYRTLEDNMMMTNNIDINR